MKPIFLDIDGVLNSISTAIALNRKGMIMDEKVFDNVAVGLVRKLVECTGAKIVISSSWRIGRQVEDFKNYFAYYGWEDAPVVGMTPITLKGYRVAEILRFIESWDEGTEDKITKAVAIDDGNLMFPGSNKVIKAIRTSNLYGFRLNEFFQALGWLNPLDKLYLEAKVDLPELFKQ